MKWSEDLIRDVETELALTRHETIQFLESWRTLLEEIWKHKLEQFAEEKLKEGRSNQ
jgi:hypothetical protein